MKSALVRNEILVLVAVVIWFRPVQTHLGRDTAWWRKGFRRNRWEFAMVEILRVIAIVEILQYAGTTSMFNRVVMQTFCPPWEDPQPRSISW